MNGVLLIDKPKGWTSFDVVTKIRSILREAQQREDSRLSHVDAAQGSNEKRASRTNAYVERASQTADTAMRRKHATGMAGSASQQGNVVRKVRVGHTGTLDPLASGLLVLVVGDYTKRAQEFLKLDKTYEVIMKLGETSTTGDEEGQKIAVSKRKPEMSEVKSVLQEFIGEIEQIPPAFSAIKINGQRAYKLARKGKEVKLESRTVKIYDITDIKYDYPVVSFTTKVSSGTYIRSLVEDIGQKLNTGAYMTELKRTEVGEFKLKNAVAPDYISLLDHIFTPFKDTP